MSRQRSNPQAGSGRAAVAPAPAHRLTRTGLTLALAGTALVFCRDFAHTFSSPKFLCLCAGVWLGTVGVAVSRGRSIVRTALDLPLAACLLAMALSAPGSTDRWLSLLGAENLSFGLWPTAVLMAFYWLACQSVEGRELELLDVALVVYGLVGFYAVLQSVGLDLFKGMPPLPSGRPYSTLGSPVSLGEDMTLFLPLALHRVRTRAGGFVGWACLAALACGLLVSVSRGAWLSSIIACGVFLAVGRNRAQPFFDRRRLILAGSAVLVLACAFTWMLRRRDAPSGDGGRTLIWRSAWDLFNERPLLGWGANTFSVTSRLKRTVAAVRLSSVKEIPNHAHDDVLHALVTTGVLGLAAYLWLCGALTMACLRAARDPERPWADALACGLLGLFLNMKVNPVSLEALVGAAFFASLLVERRPAARFSSPTVVVASAAATASLFLAVRLAAADLSERSAGRALAGGRLDQAVRESAEAVRRNPWDMGYRLEYVNALARLSSRLAPPSSGNSRLLETALAAAREGAALHPRHPDAYYAEGIALLNLAYLDLSLHGKLGDLRPARTALDRALALDATYLPTIQARLVVAQSLNEGEVAEQMTRRVSEIQDGREAPGESPARSGR